ncbi:MAG: YbgC/FadM family acyl-CoA thioesterase [Candidatus Magnetoovum sp. WYHC-5]|nr:YbgC/FadM family acyl-CoA thioesterase [Candidatus Magnetoovum sp. WYHC-5]
MEDTIEVKIYYEDTDCGGVVYYGKYLTYLEWARTHYLEKRQISISKLMEEGIFFVVIHVDINYRKPVKYGEMLTVTTDIGAITKTTITFQHSIFNKKENALVAISSVQLACVKGNSMRPVRLKEEITEALKK